MHSPILRKQSEIKEKLYEQRFGRLPCTYGVVILNYVLQNMGVVKCPTVHYMIECDIFSKHDF